MKTGKLGIDVGGTFTDFVLARAGEPPHIHKTLSTPADPSIAVIPRPARLRRLQKLIATGTATRAPSHTAAVTTAPMHAA